MSTTSHMEEITSALVAEFGESVSEPRIFREETTITIKEPERIAQICQFLKTKFAFDYLVDITSIDHYGDDPRFELSYELNSLTTGAGLRLKTAVGEEQGSLPSVSGVWKTADWHEREIFDMMGISFDGHPNMKRILMWEGYPYYPLRKDFPLAGKPSEMPDVAFTDKAPLEGGPFVTAPTDLSSVHKEPRAKQFD